MLLLSGARSVRAFKLIANELADTLPNVRFIRFKTSRMRCGVRPPRHLPLEFCPSSFRQIGNELSAIGHKDCQI